MFLSLLKDAMLVRCESRRQQLVVAVGMGVLSLGIIAFLGWSVLVAESARATLVQFAERDELGFYRFQRQRNNLYFVMAIWYTLGMISVIPALIIGGAGMINFGRWVSFTGTVDER